MLLLKLLANAFAAFFDFSIGTFTVYGAAQIFHYDASLLHYFIGGILAVAPDFDVLYMFARKGRVYGDHHQFITHRPLVTMTLATAMGILLNNMFWTITAPLCLFWHYVHDTEGFGGGGIAWLWPFSKLYYSPRRTVSPKTSLMASEKDKFDSWLENRWMTPNATSIVEISAGSIMLGSVLINAVNWQLGCFAMLFIWATLTSMWQAHAYLKNRK